MELVHFLAVWVTRDTPDAACGNTSLVSVCSCARATVGNHRCSDNRGMVGPKGSRKIYMRIQIL